YAPELLALIETGPRRSPFQTYFHAVIRLNRGERAEGTRLLDSLLAHRDPKMPPKLYDLVGAAKGWTTMMAGDTAAGIRQMRTGLENVGAGWNSFMTAPIRLQLATALAQRPDTREEGRRLLQHGFVYDAGIEPITRFALGRIEEAAGDKAAAIEAYSRFLKLWDKADPSLAPQVTEARDALARLTGEPKS